EAVVAGPPRRELSDTERENGAAHRIGESRPPAWALHRRCGDAHRASPDTERDILTAADLLNTPRVRASRPGQAGINRVWSLSRSPRRPTSRRTARRARH